MEVVTLSMFSSTLLGRFSTDEKEGEDCTIGSGSGLIVSSPPCVADLLLRTENDERSVRSSLFFLAHVLRPYIREACHDGLKACATNASIKNSSKQTIIFISHKEQAHGLSGNASLQRAFAAFLALAPQQRLSSLASVLVCASAWQLGFFLPPAGCYV